ncbi:MAG: 1,4-alpha-glucan branching protein GlgB [Oscillospiraceae bacterium]
MDMHEFYMGNVFDAYEFFGAHPNPDGTVFRTFAPSAERITIIGEWNDWQEENMIKDGHVWSYFSAKAKKGQMYKYVIYSSLGRVEHCDPYGFAMELRPNFASIITDLDEYKFTDSEWLEKRSKNYNEPLNIYEVHIGSWHTDPDNENGWYSYSDIADKLIKYVKKHHYTHIEFMPLSEHPADCSWGYQNTGFFAPTSRYGTPAQLMKLIDKCHKNDIGVIMDFVPVHFAMDGYALAKYDGTCLYEYPDSDVTISEWGTCNFIHSRREVCCFLQSAANYWLEKYHFDGLRMDAISRAIYWQGDPERGVNKCTVDFLKKMNSGLHALHPTAMLIAEDSTAFPKVTAPVEYDGLGFDYKWDLGWMNDTLDYFRTPPAERKYHHGKITFSMQYFYNELYLLPISHDENVHGKATVIQKMWGDYDVKFPQARAFYMYMYSHPGKKAELHGRRVCPVQRVGRNKRAGLGYTQISPLHDSFLRYMTDLEKLYTTRPSLYNGEYNPDCFKWILPDESERSVFAYKRCAENETTICLLNFSDREQTMTIPTDGLTDLKELINSDSNIYSGKTEVKRSVKIKPAGGEFSVKLSPFSGRLFDGEVFSKPAAK